MDLHFGLSFWWFHQKCRVSFWWKHLKLSTPYTNMRFFMMLGYMSKSLCKWKTAQRVGFTERIHNDAYKAMINKRLTNDKITNIFLYKVANDVNCSHQSLIFICFLSVLNGRKIYAWKRKCHQYIRSIHFSSGCAVFCIQRI